jgi:magnesium-transporting ATPase (P-type)
VVLVAVEIYRRIVLPGQWDLAELGSIAQFVLVLLIASIPVALPAVMSVTMAIGAYALSRQKAILSRLSAIEELAGVDILCSDKTGTLTMNQLTVEAPIPFGGAAAADVLLAAALATRKSSDDPIDLAVFHALKTPSTLDGFRQTAFVPFDPVNKRTEATVVDAQGKVQHYAKGAPQVIADLAKLDPIDARPLPGRGQLARRPRLAGAGRCPPRRRCALADRRPDLADGSAASRCQVDDRGDPEARPRRQDGDRRRRRDRRSDRPAARPRRSSSGSERHLQARR